MCSFLSKRLIIIIIKAEREIMKELYKLAPKNFPQKMENELSLVNERLNKSRRLEWPEKEAKIEPELKSNNRRASDRIMASMPLPIRERSIRIKNKPRKAKREIIPPITFPI